MEGLWTTQVGSLPKPPDLVEARAKFARGKLSPEELHELELRYTKFWVEFQDQLGLDIIVDGEMYRGDMATYFAEHLQGMEISGLVRSYGNRYYRKPIAVGPLKRPKPITVEWFRYAQSLTSKPVKGMITGPYTMAEWSFNNYYDTQEAFVLAMAEVLHEEAVDLAKAGAKYIQVDEPAVSTRPEDLQLAIRAMKVVTAGIEATFITHICYGDFASIYPDMLELPVHIFDLEMANSNYDLLELLKTSPFSKKLSLGVIDVHSHVIETKEQVKQGIYKALELLPPDRLLIDPDCGLKTRTVEEAQAKLRVMKEATDEVRQELGLENAPKSPVGSL
jgi:5-methyltetrahydropteroyltriglutamate--homocysteine methyltransferase